MSETIKVDVHVLRNVYLWFLPYEPTDGEVIISDVDSEELTVHLSYDFDYERLPKDNWRMHIDTEIDVVSVAKVKARTSFEIACKQETLFQPELLTSINKIAIESAERAFFEQCKAHGIEPGFTKIINPDERANDFVSHMIEQFHLRQKQELSFPKQNQGGISFTPGNKTLLYTHGTFIILDQVLHCNKLFDLKHNREVFHAIVPEAVYYTIKLICAELSQREIKLVYIHNVLFQICLDCAIQLMLDRHAETLQPAILEVGFTQENQKFFIQFGSDLLRTYRDSLKQSGARILSLEEKRDWNSMIR